MTTRVEFWILDGKVDVVGTNLGPNVTLKARNDTCFVIKSAGHKRFGGQGQRQIYEPGKYIVYEILQTRKPSTNREVLIGKQLISVVLH